MIMKRRKKIVCKMHVTVRVLSGSLGWFQSLFEAQFENLIVTFLKLFVHCWIVNFLLIKSAIHVQDKELEFELLIFSRVSVTTWKILQTQISLDWKDSMLLQWNDVNNNQHIEAYPWTIHNMSKSSFSSLHMYFGGGSCQNHNLCPKNFLAPG